MVANTYGVAPAIIDGCGTGVGTDYCVWDDPRGLFMKEGEDCILNASEPFAISPSCTAVQCNGFGRCGSTADVEVGISCPTAQLYLGDAFESQAGAAGHRYLLPSAMTMIHQPASGTRGKITDMQIDLEEGIRLKKQMTELYVKHNSKGKTYEEFVTLLDRDKWLTAPQAIELGLADHIVDKRP